MTFSLGPMGESNGIAHVCSAAFLAVIDSYDSSTPDSIRAR